MSNQEIPLVDLNVEEQLSLSEDNSVCVENEVNLEVNRNQSADNSVS